MYGLSCLANKSEIISEYKASTQSHKYVSEWAKGHVWLVLGNISNNSQKVITSHGDAMHKSLAPKTHLVRLSWKQPTLSYLNALWMRMQLFLFPSLPPAATRTQQGAKNNFPA